MCPLKVIRFILDYVRVFLSSSRFRAGKEGKVFPLQARCGPEDA